MNRERGVHNLWIITVYIYNEIVEHS